MSDELKPCPYCGNTEGNGMGKAHESEYVYCQCGARKPIIGWNNRPIEEALQKRIEELTGALNLATDAIAAVVGCCTYADIEKCQTGAYGISIKAGNLIHKFLTNHHDLLAELSE